MPEPSCPGPAGFAQVSQVTVTVTVTVTVLGLGQLGKFE